jgi:membrane protein
MKVLSKGFFRELWKVTLATVDGFINDNGLKLSASLAYYTIFSIAPLLIITLSISSFVLGQYAINNGLYPHIKQYVGSQAALQIQETIKNLQLSGKSGIALVIGIIILVVGASSMFVEIQDSLNIIWNVKAKPKRGWVKLVQNRFLSFSLIISVGFLLVVTLIVDLILKAISTKLEHFLHNFMVSVFSLVNHLITFLVIAILFGIIFKFLPDVKIRWKDVRAGAIFTAVLFMLGRYLIGLYIEYTAQGSAYGEAGSIIVILIWVYYTSIILYFGAEFTQVYAEAMGRGIEPAEYAVHVQQVEVEEEVSKLPAQHPDITGHFQDG